MPKPHHPEPASPDSSSPVLDAWALAGNLEKQGTDAHATIHNTAPHIDPTAPVSAEGIPLIPRDWVAGLPPDKIAAIFYDALLSAAGRERADWDLMCQRFHDLPTPWRLVYTVCSFQNQVDNGGLDQFFYNGQGEFDDDTACDLARLGTGKFLALFVAARRVYYAAPSDRADRIPELEALTDEFYAQPKDPYHFVGEHILSNQSIYCCD